MVKVCGPVIRPRPASPTVYCAGNENHGRIEPLPERLRTRHGIGADVRDREVVSANAIVVVQTGRKRKPALKRRDAIDLPSTDDVADNAVRKPLMTRADRKLVIISRHQAIWRIVGREPPIEITIDNRIPITRASHIDVLRPGV